MEFGLVAAWIAILVLLGLVALPVSTWLFRDLDAASFALPLALAVLGIVGFLVGHVAFGWPAAIAGLVVLAVLSVLAADRVDVDWRAFAEPAAVFAVAFLLVVAIRSISPVAAPLPLATGEKFLDFGLLKSLDRSATLPPQDMWYAGKSIQYHYGGHMLTTLLATITGTEIRFAYNLGLATFYAGLVTAAYGLAGSIVQPYDVSRRLAAGLGAFFVGIAANLETSIRLAGWLLPDGLVGVVVDTLGLEGNVGSWTPADFGYFDASRVIPVDPGADTTFQAATEFPLFAWLNGDLHAHMMSQVFVVLVAGLLLAYWRTPADERNRRRVLLFGVVPPVAGLVSTTNIWSFPTVGGLTLLTVLFAPGDPAALLPDRLRTGLPTFDRDNRWVEEGRRLGVAVAAAPLVLLLGVLWTAPFWLGPVANGPDRPLAPWDARTPLGRLLVVNGAFLAAFLPYVGRRLGVATDRPAAVWGAGLALALGAILVGFPALALILPVGLASWWLLRTQSDVGFELVLVLAGAGLVLLVELVTIEGERFNVIFKPYVEVWLFWAIATAAVLARLVRGWPADLLPAKRERWRTTGMALALVLVLSTGTYAVLALPDHFESGTPAVEAEGPTLDATAYVEYHEPAEAPAIRWLDARQAQPTIVDAPGRDRYYWTNAPSSLTGLPTVVGWVYNEKQYGREDPERRAADVETIFTGDAERQAALLDQYDVDYVYVGPRERETYDTITVDRLEGVSVAKQWPEVTIYAVDRAALG